MRSFLILSLAMLLAVGTFVGPAAAQRAARPLDAQQVATVINRGVVYLKRTQSARGTWQGHLGYPGGVTALCALALLNAGVEPDDLHIQKALNALREIKPQKTYVVALQTMVFCLAEPQKKLLIQKNVDWLESRQIKDGPMNGAWAYGDQGNGDNSNTQFAILALYEAERVGVEVSDQTWQRAYDYWTRNQNDNGSWGYLPSHPGTGSMTCAGIASLVITSGKIGEGDARVVAGKVQCCGEQEENVPLERALEWLGRNFSVERNPGNRGASQSFLYYYLYGLERVGRMTARRFIGNHDWYREGAAKLVRDQDVLTGSWKAVGHAENRPEIATSLALLFLSKGRRPVVVAKLKYKPGNDWNHHRGDLANLTTVTERRWNKDLTWQVIDAEAAQVEDLLEAPVLFISGRLGPKFTARQKQNLRDYIDRGGFIFAEGCCDGQQFDLAFRRLMADVFPEPEYKLRLLPPEHPVWYAELQVDPDYLRPLWGIEYGCRTSVVYCPADLSCYWELGRSGRDTRWPKHVQDEIDAALAIGVNVLTYATNREPKEKDPFVHPIDTRRDGDESKRGTIYIAKLLHPGRCNAAPGALINLLRAAEEELDIRISTEDRQLLISDPALFRYHMAFMHGRQNFRLTPAERKGLRLFVERGGMLLVDSVCASPAFTDSFRREMKTIFPDRPLERIPSNHPIFTKKFGGYDITTVTRREPGRRQVGEPLRAKLREVEPDLEGIQIDDRYRVIFSPQDISCALEKHESLECKGYTRQDATRIGLNVLLYSLHQ